MTHGPAPTIEPIQTQQARFQCLLNENRGILFKVAYLYCRDPEDRRDLVQEIGAQLWKSFSSYDRQRPYSTWMYRVALNVAISFVRSTALRQRHFADRDEAEIAQVENPDVEVQTDDRIPALREFMFKLDALNRALLLLYLEDHSYRDIAKTLGISETNVATKIGRLKQRIRREIN